MIGVLRARGTVAQDQSWELQDFPYCVINNQIGRLRIMAKGKPRVYKTTTITRAKAAAAKARSAKKKASRESPRKGLAPTEQ